MLKEEIRKNTQHDGGHRTFKIEIQTKEQQTDSEFMIEDIPANTVVDPSMDGKNWS